MSESNLFAAKDGYTVHFKITADELPALMKNTEIFIDWMKNNGYVHDTTRDKPARGGGGRPPKAAPKVMANGHAIEVKCGDCGNDVYDNRAENDKREARGERRRPDFKCKKCEWICWDADALIDTAVGSDGAYEPDAVPFE